MTERVAGHRVALAGRVPQIGTSGPVSMLSRLFVLVAVALLPAIAIQAHNEFDLRRAREVEVQNHAPAWPGSPRQNSNRSCREFARS